MEAPTPTPNASTDKVNEPTTPKNTAKNSSTTPRSVSKSPSKHTTSTPGAAHAAGSGAGGVRGRQSVRRVDTLPPSLLTDFFLGRPSQARRAAQKARRESMDAIKAELRQEMRAEAVRKVQPPGGVRDRVKAWQKKNAAAMAVGDPQATPSVPGDVAFESDQESVTEEDRLRIKFQQQQPKRSFTPKAKRVSEVPDLNEGSRSMPVKINQPPKKRVVSDDHWMKIKIKKKPSHRRRSPNTAARIPRDFLQRSMNPPASSKVKEWVKAVETPVYSPSQRPRSPNSRIHRPRHTKSLSSIVYKDVRSEGASEYTDISDEEDEDEDEDEDDEDSQDSEDDYQEGSQYDFDEASDAGAASAPPEQPLSPMYDDPSIHVKPLRMSKIKTPAPSAMSMPEDDGIRVRGSDIHDDGIRVTPSEPNDDGIRVTASEPAYDDGIRVTASEPNDDGIRVTPSEPNDDGIRVTASHADNDDISVAPSEPHDDGIRVKPAVPFDDGIRVRGSDLGDDGIRVSAVEDPSDGIRVSPLQAAESALSSALNNSMIGSNVQEASFSSSRRSSRSKKAVPTKAKASGSHSKPHARTYGKTGGANAGLGRHTPSKSRSKGSHRRTKSLGPPATRSVRTCSFSTGSSFTNDVTVEQIDVTEEPIDDAPVDEPGDNDLPMGAEAHNMKRQPSKQAKRTSSFRHVPQVFKKVMSEGKKILHETHEPPRPPQGNPPARIENWLNATVEPAADRDGSRGPIKKAVEKEWVQESQSRRTAELEPAAKIESKTDSMTSERKPEPKAARGPVVAEKPKAKGVEKQKEQDREPDMEKTPKRRSGEKDRARGSASPSPETTPKASKPRSISSSHSSHTQTDKTPAAVPVQKVKKTTSTSSLQRKGANRSNTVSSRASASKRPFKEALRDAFRGESVGHNLPPAAYQSHEERTYEIEIDLDGHYIDDEWDRTPRRRSPSGSDISYGTNLTFDVGFSDNGIPDSDLAPAPLRRRAPPTQGHVLSAVIPEDQTLEADDTTELSGSNRSQTNVTQPTSVGTENYKSDHGRGGRDGSVYRQPSYVSGGDTISRNASYLSAGDTTNRSASDNTINRNPSFVSGRETINRKASYVSGRETGSRNPDRETVNRNPSFVSGRETINRNASFVSRRETLDRRGSRASVSRHQSLNRNGSRYSRHSDANNGSLKRRLTKHSDLVSVLSMTEEEAARPSSRVSSLSRHSRRSGSRSSRHQRRMSGLGSGSIAGLLRDFAAEEEVYLRELKALVDGVVPVLLKEVLREDSAANMALFDSPKAAKDDSFSKSVVSMGVALEELRNAHKKAPLTDIYQLFAWLERVQPVYDAYLDAWRLGFHDLVVNLAPLIDTLDDDDSLLDAMPRNDEGDLVDADGERVDVAHFLKRPLQRIKRVMKFLRGVIKVLPSATTSALLESFDQLHVKARRRYNEEIARITDKEAADTDTSQCLNLQTMDALVDVTIDKTRQVNAKDVFALTLWHSNGQRLECQVELVYRDKPKSAGDPGDLLIRKTDGYRQTTLLFQPATMDFVSGRRDGPGIIVMIRGLVQRPAVGQDGEWSELLHLGTDDEEQIDDWLAIFSPTPIPDPRRNRTPLGPSTLVAPMLSTILEGGSTVSASEPEPRQSERDHSPESDHTVTDQQAATEDKPPAPPVHRTLSKPSAPPPVFVPECLRPGFNRRTSSPLKHEYLPSDVSSDHSAVVTEEDTGQVYSDPEDDDDEEEHSGDSQSGSQSGSLSDSDSDSDEIDSIDLPQTELGISIRDEERQCEFRAATASVMTYESLTPSKSASQVCGRDESDTEDDDEDEHEEEDLKGPRFLAKISQWSDKKATWKDLKPDNCWVVVLPGSLEVHQVGTKNLKKAEPLVALDLTPAILLRQSTFIDLEVRASTLSYGTVFARAGANFRFRCQSTNDCYEMYTAVHSARLKNERYNKMEADARVKAFGTSGGGGGGGSGALNGNSGGNNDAQSMDQKRGSKTSWFGRRNSYRAAARAPANSNSASQDGFSNAPSSNTSAASSFLRRLTGGNLSFNLAKSTLNRQASGRSASRNEGSLYSANSSRGGPGLRAPSLSMASHGVNGSGVPLNTDAIKIRLHLLATQTRWEDWGNCMLTVSRPPPGQHMDLRKNHGLEKRVTVSTIPKKSGGSGAAAEQPTVIIDAVLGSGCFSPMGNRGVVCGIWEEVKDEQGVRGRIPQNGTAAGNITKWCFQCKNSNEAQWVLRNLHQEVELF